MEPQSLYQYLEEHKCKKGGKSTHTRIPNKDLGIYAGSYTINSEDESFKKVYVEKVFENQQQEYLTEAQLPIAGPVLIDFDFRYSTEIEERQHTDEHITDIIDLYLQILRKIITITEETFPVFIFEKPNVNTLDDVTKDGIHMIIGIHLHHEAQMVLRECVLKEIGNVMEDLPLTNDYESVLDKGISTGKTNWQLYGSRKPGNEAYRLVKHYSVVWDDDDFEWEDLTCDINHKEIFDLVSARKKDNIAFALKDDILERCKNADSSKAQSKKRMKLRNIKLKRNRVQNHSSLPTNMNELQKAIENNLLIAGCNDDLYEVKEVHKFTMALADFRAEDREEWFKIGLALHACDSELLFATWILFSTKSDKFDFEDIPMYWEKYWNGDFDVQRGSLLTRGSIMWWCRQDNPTEYQNIKEGTVDYFINKTIANEKPPDYDIAGILHKMYGDQYKCVSIKNNKWYEMIRGRWSEIDSGTTLRKKLSSQLSVKYTQKQKEILQRFHAIDEPFSSDNGESKSKDEEAKKDQERKELQKTARRVADISLDLRRTTHKNNIMKESKEWFFDKHFMEKLDANPLLLCFRNGIIDFKEKIFRPAKPDDYISLCTNIDYMELDETNPVHLQNMKEITTFMEQLFPEPPLNKYMWQFLANSMRGTNENQVFTILTGTGRNGKSKLMELMGLTLGDYKGTVPITLITNKRQVIGGASPEIAQLKGLRLAIMQEPSENMQINEGIMKELTGGDPLSGRALYCDTVTFNPQFSLAVCTNHLFDIKSTDDGTWRRIRVCDFQSKFLDEPYKNSKFPKKKYPYQYKVERNIDSKFTTWAPYFAAMLVKIVFDTEGVIEDCPSVMASSQKYKLQQDYFEQFYEERIVESQSSVIKRKDMYNEFNLWYSELYGGKIPKGKDLYDFMGKKLGKIDSRGRFKGWRLIHSFEDELDITPNNI
tara:strand:+ start:1657 stop:4470 length:2814 start_codon:yes stop_codon:yes gene_type:complete